MEKRLGPTFHRTFGLMRVGLAHVVRVAAENEASNTTRNRNLTFKELSERTNLGSQQVNSMRGYAIATGLLDENEFLTALGKAITNHDPGISQVQTLWILHYYLSSPVGQSPGFWPHLIENHVKPGREVTTRGISSLILEYYKERPDETINPESAKKCASAFLSTYSNADGLGALGLLNEVAAGRYSVGEIQFPPLHTVAYLLDDSWEKHSPGTKSIHLTQVFQSLCPVLFSGSGRLKQALSELQTIGLVMCQQRTPPFQVTKLWTSSAQLLADVYANS